MTDDRFTDPLRGLGDVLSAGIDVPPYEAIEKRRVRRRRTRAASSAVGVVALVAAGIGVGPVVADSLSGSPSNERPVAAVTVTVPPPVRGALSLRDVIFDDTGYGVALGQRCNTVGSCDTVVLASSDAGVSFGAEQVVTREGVVGPAKITMGPNGLLVAYDPGLYVSRDGGASWRNVTPPGYAIRDVVSRGKSFNALAVSIDDRAELLSVPISNLTDPTFTHTVIPGADASARLQQDGADLVLVGSDAPGSVSRARLLLRDGDGSWRTVEVPDACASPSFSAPNARAWWLVCAGPPTAAGRTKTVYVSADRGVTWSSVTAVPYAGDGGTLTAASAQVAYVSGPAGPLYVTRDGGTSWQTVLVTVTAGYGQPHILHATGPGGSWVTSGRTVWSLGSDGVWRDTVLS